MTEHWTTEDLQEYLKNGKTPSRNHTPSASANMESSPRNAPVAAHEIPPFNSPVHITFHSTRTRLADADGISGKAALDGIVAAGILRDDSAEFVQAVEHRQEKGKQEETRIVIEEV